MKIFLILFLVLTSNFSIYSQSKFNIELNSGVNFYLSETSTDIDNWGYERSTDLKTLNKEGYFYTQLNGNYNIRDYLQSGIGLEFNRFVNDFNLVSFMGNINLQYPSITFKPFMNLSAGYSINTQEIMFFGEKRGETHGGFLYVIGIGLSYYLNNRMDLLVKGNYKYMKINQTFGGFMVEGSLVERKTSYNFLNLSVGINFKL